MTGENHQSVSNQKEKSKEQIAQEQAINKHRQEIKLLLECKPKPAIACATVTLEEIKDSGYLDVYLEKTNYEIFQWILEHDNLKLFQALINLISKQRAAWMVTHNDYSAIRDYVDNILQLSPKAYKDKEAKSVRCSILKTVISFKLNHVTNPIYNVIKEIIRENKKNNVSKMFEDDIEKVIDELKTEKNYPIKSTPVSLVNGLLPKPKLQPQKHVRFDNQENSKAHTSSAQQLETAVKTPTPKSQGDNSTVKSRRTKRSAITVTQEIKQNGDQTTPVSCMPSPKPQPKRRSVRQKNSKERHTNSPQQPKSPVIESHKRKRSVTTAIQKTTQNGSQTTPASCMSSHGLLSKPRPQKRTKFDNQENSKAHTNSAQQSEIAVEMPAPI